MRRSLAVLVAGALAGGAAVGTTAAVATPQRLSAHPASEHVPAAVNDVRISYRDSTDETQNRTVVLHGKRADQLIDIFNGLRRESRNTMHCLAMGTASTTVTFKGPHHKWAATQMICTGLTVTRDGAGRPTLVPTKEWTAVLTRYLGHTPTGSGDVTPNAG
jgi:hypothetical protein